MASATTTSQTPFDLGFVCFTENHFRKNVFPENDLRKNILQKKKREKKTRKMFYIFQIRKTFYRKMAYFQLTRKIFSVDHLFSAKQTPENAENSSNFQ